MKKASITILVLLFFNALLTAQNKVSVKNIPNWVDKISYNFIELDVYKDSIGDGYYYPLQDYQVNFAEKSYYYHYARKILSEKGVQNNSEINVEFDPSFQKLVFHEVKIIRNVEVINKLELKNIKILNKEEQQKSFIYNGLLTAALVLDDVRANDIIEYSFSIEGANPVYKGKYFDDFILQFYDPTKVIYRSILLPKGRTVTFKNNFTDYKPTITTVGSSTKYVWKLNNVSGLHPEADAPSWYFPYSNVYLSEYKSWNEIIEWGLELYSTKAINSSKILSVKIDQIANSYLTKEERLSAALQFIQDSIRYTGIENGIWGHKPFSPNEVFSSRYGDCKGKSLLLCWMLNKLGIIAYPALVNTRNKQEIINWLPAPSAFDHCIVNVDLNGKQFWYDATASLQRGPYNRIYIANYHYALVLKPANNALTKIELTENNISKIKISEDYYIDKVGAGAILNVTSTYEGYDADNNRSGFQNSTKKEIEKTYIDYYVKNYPLITSSALPDPEDDEKENIFVVNEKYKIDSLWVTPNKENLGMIESSFYAQGLYDKLRTVADVKRKAPFFIEYPLNYEYVIKLHVPEEWIVNDEEITIEAPGFVYTRVVTYRNRVVKIRHVFSTTKEYLVTSELEEYNKKIAQVIDVVGYGLTYDSNEIPKDKNWERIFFILLLAGIGFFIYKRNKMKR